MYRFALLSAIALCLSTSGAVLAQEDDGADIVLPSGDDIVETIAYDDQYLDPDYGPLPLEMGASTMGGGTEGLTSGTTEVISPRTACYVGYDSYRSRWRLALGYAYGRYTTSGRSAAANAAFDGAPCTSNGDAGSIDHGDNLEFFLFSAHHFDEVDDDGGKTYFRLKLTEYCGNGCGSTCSNYTDIYDTASCTSTSGDIIWKEALDLEGDGDSCHRPDIVLTSSSSWYPPSRSITAGYNFMVQTYVCDSDGTNCTYYYDTGCVDVSFD